MPAIINYLWDLLKYTYIHISNLDTWIIMCRELIQVEFITYICLICLVCSLSFSIIFRKHHIPHPTKKLTPAFITFDHVPLSMFSIDNSYYNIFLFLLTLLNIFLFSILTKIPHKMECQNDGGRTNQLSAQTSIDFGCVHKHPIIKIIIKKICFLKSMSGHM